MMKQALGTPAGVWGSWADAGITGVRTEVGTCWCVDGEKVKVGRKAVRLLGDIGKGMETVFLLRGMCVLGLGVETCKNRVGMELCWGTWEGVGMVWY